MTRRIALVIDVLGSRSLDSTSELWRPRELARDLVRAGVSEAPLSVGKLEDAPESWAYILYGGGGTPAESPVARARLAKTLGTTSNPLAACELAEAHAWIGFLDNIASSWFGAKRGEPNAPNFLGVKRAVGERLGWPLSTILQSENYARTSAMAEPLPRLIVKYLTAAL